MKVVIVGGGGARTPQLVRALLCKSEKLKINEIKLLDINEEHLSLIFSVIEKLNKNKDLKVSYTTDKKEAFKGADFILFTIRVGEINSRIIDEQVPLKYGVIGQETTGPGGFAMALRTIPVMLDYMQEIQKVAPEAWVLNLTNPSGLITQALIKAGYKRVIGICDSPSDLIENIAQSIFINKNELWFDYFGINHLGWIKRIIHKGQNILPEIIKNNQVLYHGETMFDPDFIRELGMIPNEYLIFYYNSKSVLEKVQKSGMSRAQIINKLNKRLFTELKNVQEGRSGLSPLSIYKKYIYARQRSYMKVETSHLNPEKYMRELWRESKTVDKEIPETSEGYAAIALSVLEGISGISPRIIILNVKNNNSIKFLDDNDIVEIPTYVDKNGVHPFSVSEIPEHCRGLLQIIKSYERLVIKAATENSYSTAIKALSLHPLIPDIEIARLILDEYIEKHGDFFPDLK